MSGPMWIEGIIENAVFRQTNGNSFAVWLAAHDAEVRAGVITEEPEWGACYQADNGHELLWFPMGNSGFAIREAAEKEVERYADTQIVLCHRRKAGPWVPVES